MSKKRKLTQQPRGKPGPGGPKSKGPPQRGPPQRGPPHKGGPPPKDKNPQKKSAPQPPQPPTIPFSPADRILLVGEGDLSFAASLVTHHACTSVTATVLEPSRAALLEKYPHAEPHIASLEATPGCKLLYGVDATKMAAVTAGRKGNKKGAVDRVFFNFPHVGGKSTDVNRQVRYNQELLVSFFRRAEPSLDVGGTIVVTLFEGEPYTLWNIRDLGRHCGFQVERSFRFQAVAYPGYAHARTLGVVKSKKGDAGGGWKGEDRPARSYVFVRKGEQAKATDAETMKLKKRKRDAGDLGSDEEFDSDFDPAPSGHGDSD